MYGITSLPVYIQTAAAGGGTTTPVALSLGITVSPSFLKRANLVRAIIGSVGVSTLKSVSSLFSVTTVGITSDTMSVGKLLSVGSTTTPTILVQRVFIVILALTITAATSLLKSVGTLLNVTTVGVTNTVLSVGKFLGVGVTTTPTLSVLRVFLVNLALTVTTAVSITVTFIAAAVTATAGRLVGLIRGLGISGRP